MTAMAYCPHCGQPLLRRCGVQLTPFLIVTFDMIAKHGDNGIAFEILAAAIYPGVDSRKAYNRVKVNINHINGRLSETRYRIICGKWGPVRLVQIKPLDYDAADDFAKSVEFGLERVRERVAAGGPKGFAERE